MDERKSIKGIIDYDAKRMKIHGKRVILYGGEIHYFRIPYQLWEDRLIKMRQAGCNFISTYIPWNWHEPEEGKYLWDKGRDLDLFLKLCQKHRLYVVLKPGPYICAEWDFGGFPDWLLARDIELRLPDAEYLALVERWFRIVARVIEPHLITRGGNVILFQVENEYDHLIEQGDLGLSRKEALRYLMCLLKITRRCGIDIPTFTNEGSFIRGTEIIDTRTFYPNIPWIWLWEFDYFERLIEESRKEQPDKPVLVLELGTGWFAQFAQPFYEGPWELLNAALKSVLIRGASLVNMYMFTGGTTFPYWGCKGDFGGIGSTTTFDFGRAPIREWGELDEKYYLARTVGLFLKSFPELVTETEIIPEAAFFIRGGERIRALEENKVLDATSFAGSYEKVLVLERLGPPGGLLLVRNLEDTVKKVAISYTSPLENIKKRLPEEGYLKLPPYFTALLPLDVAIPHTGLVISHTTSEFLTIKKIGDKQVVILCTQAGIQGEAVLKGKNLKVKVLEGKVEVKRDNSSIRLFYQPEGIKLVEIDGEILLLILDSYWAGRVWLLDDSIILTDLYYIKEIKEDPKEILLKGEAKNKVKSKTRIFTFSKPKEIKVNGVSIPFNYQEARRSLEFNCRVKEEEVVSVKWSQPYWRYKSDSEERKIDYKDRNWLVLTEPISLEKARLFGHGYFWYRTEFLLPRGASQVKMRINTGFDRVYLYLNGAFVWRGIGEKELEITSYLKPGRNLLAISCENAYHTKAHPHEGAIKKYSGIQKPIRLRGKVNNKVWEKEIREFRVRKDLRGIRKGYHKSEYSDKEWMKVKEGEKYVCGENLGNLIWFRRGFKYKKKEGWTAPLKLVIPQAEERCHLYLNGQALGRYESVGPQNIFYIPETMLGEENLLALVLEGPGFHPVREERFKPAFFKEPILETYYQAKELEIKIERGNHITKNSG